MDNSVLLIVVLSSIAFIGVVIWKLLWLFGKMKESEQANNKESD